MVRISKMSYLNIHVSMAEIGTSYVRTWLFGEPNAMGSALNTWQMPQTAR